MTVIHLLADFAQHLATAFSNEVKKGENWFTYGNVFSQENIILNNATAEQSEVSLEAVDVGLAGLVVAAIGSIIGVPEIGLAIAGAGFATTAIFFLGSQGMLNDANAYFQEELGDAYSETADA